MFQNRTASHPSAKFEEEEPTNEAKRQDARSFCCVDAASVVGLLRFFTFYLPLHTTPCTVVLLHGMPVFCTVDKETTVRTVRTVEAVGEKGVVGSLLSHILENNPIPTVLMNKCAIQKFRNPVSVPVVTTTC